MNSLNRSGVTGPAGPAGPVRQLLIIGIDGARWDIIAEPGQGVRLQQLAAEGSLHRMTMEAPTISGPGWASILTGTTHAEHGIRDNTMIGSRLWSYPDILARAFFADQSTRTFAAAGWPVLVDPHGLGPIIHPRVEQQYAGLHHVIVRDGETHGYEKIDAEIADIAAAKLNADAFDAGFVYFCGVDESGHVYGLQGEEYRAAVRRVDTHVERLLEAVARRTEDRGEDWLVVLTTDHGHRDEGGHGGDTDREKESWVITWTPGTGGLPQWPEEVVAAELAEMILQAR